MDFAFTDEQELLRESVREWCSRHFTEEKIKQWYAEGGMPDDVTKSWVDAGFGFLGIPEEHGGTSCDNVTLGVVMEELCHQAAAWVPITLTMLLMFDIVHLGTPEQIKMVMDAYRATGKSLMVLAVSEPGAGTDNMAMSTTAHEREDGKIVLNGQKTWVTNGEKAPYVMVIAKDEDPSPKNPNMSLWFFPTDTPGVSTSPLHKIGATINPFCDMYLDNVVIDKSCLLGERGKGFMNLMKNFEFERCVAVATAIGEAQAAMDDAAAYASQRIAFGKPISTYQLIGEKLTDMEIALENSRNMLYKTLWKLDNKMPVQIDAALLKRYAVPACTQVCSEAMQIFGGLGYTTETRVNRCWLDCRGLEIGGGTTEIMVHIAGRQLAKKYAR